jgi:hypothetical protein
VGEPRKSYCGEAAFPLIVQNIHRYFLYLAFPVWMVLVWDVWKAMWFPEPGGGVTFGIGAGTLVLAANAVFLYLYCTGCHSLRHLMGGRMDILSRSALRARAYRFITGLNGRHMLWAWMSLLSVAFADLYVRLCSMGIWTDWRIL